VPPRLPVSVAILVLVHPPVPVDDPAGRKAKRILRAIWNKTTA